MWIRRTPALVLLPLTLLLLALASCRVGPAEEARPGRDEGVSEAMTPTSSAPFTPQAGLAVVGPDGGVVATNDGGLTLEVPPGALPEPTEMKVVPIQPAEPDVLAVYEFGPEGLQFAKPVTITLHIRGLPEGIAIEDLEVLHIRGEEVTLITDTTVTPSGDGLVFRIEHFSRIVVRISPTDVRPPILYGGTQKTLYEGSDGFWKITVGIIWDANVWELTLDFNQSFSVPSQKGPINYSNLGTGSVRVSDSDYLGEDRGNMPVNGNCRFDSEINDYSVVVPLVILGPKAREPRLGDAIQVVFNPAGSLIEGQDEEFGSSCLVFDSATSVSVNLTGSDDRSLDDLPPIPPGPKDGGDDSNE